MAQEEVTMPSGGKLEIDEEFQFLWCENCQSEVQNPKLLPCLHNLCTKCLQETKRMGLCVICQAPHSRNAELPELQDNLFFLKLQATLRIYWKIVAGTDLICDCEKEGQFWCSDCASFLCHSCFDSHQRFLKKEGHEIRLLRDIRAETRKEFVSWNWKQSVLICPKKEHKNQLLSIYCDECQQFLCCTCAVLDSAHAGKQCDIRDEIQKRQEDLQSMTMEMKEKKQSFENTWNNLVEQIEEMEDLNKMTKDEIHQKVEEMVQVLREKEEKFLAEIEDQHKKQVQNVKMKLQGMKGVLKSMASSVQLVEKMGHYASDQEFLDMQPFIRKSFKKLKQKQPPTVDSQIQGGITMEVKKWLQALFERMTKDKEDVPPRLEMTSRKDHSAKRNCVAEERATQTPPKVIKIECNAGEVMLRPIRPASNSLMEQPGTSSESAGCGQADNTVGSTINYQRRDHSYSQFSDAGSLQLEDPSAALGGLWRFPTEGMQYTLRVLPSRQAIQAARREVLLSTSPSPALDLSLAELNEPVLSPKQLDCGQEEFDVWEDLHTELPPLSAERSDAEDIRLAYNGTKSGQNTGSSEAGSGETTISLTEEEKEQGWLRESHDLLPVRDLRFQKPPSEAEGHQEIKGSGGSGLVLFSQAPNSQLPERLPQYMSPLWDQVDWRWPEGFQMQQDASQEILRILNGYLGSLTAQMQSVVAATEKWNISVAKEVTKVRKSLAFLLDLGKNMNGEVALVRGEITQLCPLIQECLYSAGIAPRRDASSVAVGLRRRGQRSRGRGNGRQRRGRRRGALQ